MSWHETLIDEESLFLRSINEGYRTFALRYQKIGLLLKGLEKMGSFEHSKTLPRIAQLKAITIGQVEEDGDPTLAVLRSAEAAIEALEGVALQQEPPVQDDAVVDILETFHRDLQAVDVETEAAWEKKVHGRDGSEGARAKYSGAVAGEKARL